MDVKRMVILLYILYDYSIERVAEDMEMTKGEVKKFIRRMK